MSLIRSSQVTSELLTTDASKTPVGNYDALGVRIAHVADPVNPQDVVNLRSLRQATTLVSDQTMSFLTANALPPVVGVLSRYDIPLGATYRDPAVVIVPESSGVLEPVLLQPATPKLLSVGFPAAWGGGTITVSGEHPLGTPVTEVFPAAPGSVVAGSQLFTKVDGAQNDTPNPGTDRATVFVPDYVDFSLALANSPKGAMFNRVYGVAFTAKRRRTSIPTRTVEDISTGIELAVEPAMAGSSGIFAWQEKHLLIAPPTVTKVRLDVLANIDEGNPGPVVPTKQPDYSSTAAVVWNNWAGGAVTVSGIDPQGNPASESFPYPGFMTTSYGTVVFAAITSITNSAPAGGGDIALVFTPNAPCDYTARWNVSEPFPLFPNAINVAPQPGLQLEFWRKSFQNGGVRGIDPNRTRMGRRYMPYRRMSLGISTVYMGAINAADATYWSEFARPQTKQKHFRVCYYDPATGARSPLSNDVIIVGSTNADRALGGPTQTRHTMSVWIKK